MKIRATTTRDVEQICAIYAREVEIGSASFELKPPDQDEMRGRIQDVQDHGYGHFVAIEGDVVLGYAYTSSYRSRPGYRFSVEDSIYVLPQARQKGIASALLKTLIDDCEPKPFYQMVAVIGDSVNHASINLHRKMGFKDAGALRNIGFKHGRWIDTLFLQLQLKVGLPK